MMKKKHTAVIASDREVFITCDEEFVNLTCYDSTWVVDSAASFHATFRRDLFLFLQGGRLWCCKDGE
jgi:hypothetical protein